MSHLNFNTECKDSYDAVINGSKGWAMYSYDRQGDLKIFEVGDGGLEEMEDEFDEGKILYGFVRVIEPISSLTKFVLISWLGAGVPVSMKGAFNVHNQDVARFFKGFHVHVQARNPEDVEPKVIMKKVTDSAGAKFSIHKEVDRPAIAPTSPATAQPYTGLPKPTSTSLYQSNTTSRIIQEQRNTQKLPGTPIPSRPVFTHPTQSAYVVKPHPTISRFDNRPPSPVKSTYKPYEPPTETSSIVKPNAFLQQQQQKPVKDDTALKRQRYEEALREKEEREKQLSGQTVREEREKREREERERELENAKLREEMESRDRKWDAPVQTEPSIRPYAATIISRQPSPGPENANLKEEGQSRNKKWDAPVQSEPPIRPYAATIISRQPSPGPENANLKEEMQSRNKKWDAPVQSEPPIRAYEATVIPRQSSPRASTPESITSAPKSASLRATVLYDYEACEENEINLFENEIIVDIVKVDEGWWEGRNSKGFTGVFPANYVELLNDQETPVVVAPSLPSRVNKNKEMEERQEMERKAREEEQARRDREQREREEQEKVERERKEKIKKEREQQEELVRKGQEEATAPPLPSRGVPLPSSSGMQAVAIYDYEADDSNEINLSEGEVVTGIVQVDADWWEGNNSHGKRGLFPANYVEVSAAEQDVVQEEAPPPLPSRGRPAVPKDEGIVAEALYDYEKSDDNEISFAAGDRVTNIEKIDDDWWQGSCDGQVGLFPAAYVQLK